MKILATVWVMILTLSLIVFIFDKMIGNDKSNALFLMTNNLFYISTIILFLLFIVMELFFGGTK